MEGYIVVKKVVIINGSGGVGKDTFVDYVENVVPVLKVSSVDLVKEAAKTLGWDGGKSEKDRKFLSDLKILAGEYSDHSFDYMTYMHNLIFADMLSGILFLFIREPEEIERAKKEFNAITVLVTNSNVESINSNTADANVSNFEYDYVINNDSSLEELRWKANRFVMWLSGDIKVQHIFANDQTVDTIPEEKIQTQEENNK